MDLFHWLWIPGSSPVDDFRSWLTADVRAGALVTVMSAVLIALLMSFALHDASTSAAIDDAMHDQDRKRGSKYMRQALDYNVSVVQKHMGSIWLLAALLFEAGGITVQLVLVAALVLCAGLVAAHRLRANEWHDVGFGLMHFTFMFALSLAAAPLKAFAFATRRRDPYIPQANGQKSGACAGVACLAPSRRGWLPGKPGCVSVAVRDSQHVWSLTAKRDPYISSVIDP